ncbi:GtrA family protein [Egicoccus sp. AB-alg6-2]|uniref:GtrA family protein n=1 Tax=Egicoccus sp. AB-alg6-2 TaxID=3242692 RepID=UPI00359D2C7A
MRVAPARSRIFGSLPRPVRFAAVGASGVLVNLAVLAALVHLEVNYLLAAIVAAEVSILSNFVLQERFVFRDRLQHRRFTGRLLRTVAYNNADALARLPLLALLVELVGMYAVLAQALTLALAFGLRLLFMSRVVYRAPATAVAEVA